MPRRVVAVLAALWIVIATAQFVPDLTTTPPPGAIGLRTAIIDPVSNSEKLLHLPSGTTTRALIQNQPDWVQTSVQAEGGTQQYLVSVDVCKFRLDTIDVHQALFRNRRKILSLL